MKKLLILLVMTLPAWASVGDTTVVEFSEKGIKKRISISTSDKKGTSFRVPKNLNLENLLSEMGVDSTERKKAIIVIEGKDKEGKTTKDTLVAVSRDGRRIKIILNEPKGEHIEKNDTIRNENSRKYDDTSKNDSQQEEEQIAPPEPKHDGRYFSKRDFGTYFGLNNYTSQGRTIPTTEPHHLRTLGSRFFALSWRKHITLSQGKKTDVALSWGPELAWYNFMFDGNDYIADNNGTTQFMNSSKALEKSKLTVINGNLPILINIGFRESKFNIGAGVYAGYRLGSYAKQKFESGGKERTKGGFGLEDLQYGWTAEMGRKGQSTLFIRRNLSSLFQGKLAPDLNVWTVGFRF